MRHDGISSKRARCIDLPQLASDSQSQGSADIPLPALCRVDADYQPPFAFTGKLNKVTLTIDRPKLSPEDIEKLKQARGTAAKARE